MAEPADRLLTPRQGVAAAVVLAALVIAGLAVTPEAERVWSAALTCQTVVAIYLGFAIVRGRWGELGVEVAFFLVATAAISLSRDGSAAWLAAVLGVHGFWDLLHHRRPDLPRVGTRNVPRWYPPACLAFDWPVAVAVMLLLP
jgi:hypothetical protein